MSHIDEDILMELANEVVEDGCVSKDNNKYIEHLEICETCYRNFCHYFAMVDSLCGQGIVTIAERMAEAKETIEAVNVIKNVVASFRIVRKEVDKHIAMAMEQISAATAAMRFSSPLAYAARGTEATVSGVNKIEDINNSSTYMMLDESTGTLRIQIELESDEEFHVLINGNEVELVKRNGYLVGRVENVSDGDLIEFVRI